MRFKDNCQVFVRPLQETGVCVCVFCMFVCMYVCLFVRVCLFVCVFLCLSVCARKTRKVRIRVCARCMKWALIGTIVFISPHVKTLSCFSSRVFQWYDSVPCLFEKSLGGRIYTFANDRCCWFICLFDTNNCLTWAVKSNTGPAFVGEHQLHLKCCILV